MLLWPADRLKKISRQKHGRHFENVECRCLQLYQHIYSTTWLEIFLLCFYMNCKADVNWYSIQLILTPLSPKLWKSSESKDIGATNTRTKRNYSVNLFAENGVQRFPSPSLGIEEVSDIHRLEMEWSSNSCFFAHRAVICVGVQFSITVGRGSWLEAGLGEPDCPFGRDAQRCSCHPCRQSAVRSVQVASAGSPKIWSGAIRRLSK